MSPLHGTLLFWAACVDCGARLLQPTFLLASRALVWSEPPHQSPWSHACVRPPHVPLAGHTVCVEPPHLLLVTRLCVAVSNGRTADEHTVLCVSQLALLNTQKWVVSTYSQGALSGNR